MLFLQPWVLFALPVVLLPVVIHLLNQRRHRPVDWGAMHFLRKASRMHQGAARLRYWLILLMRLIAVACVLLLLSRPLATGWFSLMGNSPSKVVVILDRSPSMAMTDSLNGLTKRASALAKLDAMFESLGNRAERILFLSPQSPPLIVPPNVRLADLVETQSTDASTNIPGLFAEAVRYIHTEGLGPTDIWCCSDLQANDWDTKSGIWPSVREAMAALPHVRLNLLNSSNQEQFNAAVRVHRTTLRRNELSAELLIDFSVHQTSGKLLPRTVPVTVNVGNSRVVVEVELNGREANRNGFAVPIDAALESGAGTIELQSDANLTDNTYYFAFAKPPIHRTLIVAEEETIGAVLRLMASTPLSQQQQTQCEVISFQKLANLNLDGVGLLIWQAPLPDEKTAAQIKQFIAAGRGAIFFPPSNIKQPASESMLYGLQWQGWSEVDGESPQIKRWRKDSDLLRNTEAGDVLPVDALQVSRVCKVDGRDMTSLASFRDDTPFLCKAAASNGIVYFCCTLPTAEYSALAEDGIVLYAMIQRALAEGSMSVGGIQTMTAGATAPIDLESWERIDAGDKTIVAADRANHAASYRSQNRILAINRSTDEDDPTCVLATTMESLLSGSSVRVVNDEMNGTSNLTREVWRWFAVAVVVALLVEAFLSLPNKGVATSASTSPLFNRVVTAKGSR